MGTSSSSRTLKDFGASKTMALAFMQFIQSEMGRTYQSLGVVRLCRSFKSLYA
jgi:hypothetical protein